jgi:hypothetical protein
MNNDIVDMLKRDLAEAAAQEYWERVKWLADILLQLELWSPGTTRETLK